MVPPQQSAGNPTEDPMSRIDEGTLYVIIRQAVEDAIMGVIGTLLLVGVALVLVWFGVMVTASAFNSNRTAAFGGIFVILIGFYMALSALEMIPPLSDLR